MFSRIMDLLHPIFMWLNWAMCLFNLSQGNFTSAAISGVIAAILTWKLTW